MPPANDDYRKRLAERKRLLTRASQKQQREKAFSTPAPERFGVETDVKQDRVTDFGKPFESDLLTTNQTAKTIDKFIGQMGRRYSINIVKGARDVVKDTATGGEYAWKPAPLWLRAFVPDPVQASALYNIIGNEKVGDVAAPLDFAGASGVLRGIGRAATSKAGKAVLGAAGAGIGFGAVNTEQSEARGGAVKSIIKSGIGSSQIRNQVEAALGDTAGGAVKGLSKFATNLISLGLPLDKKIIEQTLDPASIEALGATKNMAFTGPYRINLRLDPTEGDLAKRVSGLLSGTKQRLQSAESSELLDLTSEVDDLIEANSRLRPENIRLLESLDVPVEKGLSVIETLANRPRHLIDDWNLFRADNPNVPFMLQRWSPGSRGPLYMGPAGEHPLGVSGARRIGEASKWSSSPELNDLTFWLHYFPNILKGGESPAIWIPKFKERLPGMADVVMPEGGYVSNAYKAALEDTKRLFPDYLEELARTQLDAVIGDMRKPGRTSIKLPKNY